MIDDDFFSDTPRYAYEFVITKGLSHYIYAESLEEARSIFKVDFPQVKDVTKIKCVRHPA